MIWGNVKYIDHYKGISHALDVALDYLAAGDFKELENGKLDLEAGVFVKLLDQGLKNSRDWEAHKKYLDVHVMLRGTEQIDLNFIQNMKLNEFVEKDDFLPMDGNKNSSVVLTDGDFLICYPNDGHRTAVQAGDKPETIKKAIFKVRI